MTIDEAIALLKEAHKHNYAWRGSKLDEAVKLGTEALKLIKEGRCKPGGMFFHDLPGETED